MYGALKDILSKEIQSIREQGLYKDERLILGPQGSGIQVEAGGVINFCANNYLGLSSHPKIMEAAHRGLEERGYGMSSVRFICGTQDIHRELEKKLAAFLGMEATILYSSCFDANGGLFETLLGAGDVIISDQLNHASIIDGVRLCKADRKRFANSNMHDLEEILKASDEYRLRMIATDGVFSMDGNIAQLDTICDLAEKYDALVMVDDSHATGFVGETGRGTHEHRGVMGRVDIITSTLGKAMGGASGGFTGSHKEVVEFLRQRSRPYLFSNSLAPSITMATMTTLDLLQESSELRDRLDDNTMHFRSEMTKAGFDIKEGTHPIVPIMLGDAKLAHDVAGDLLEEGIYVIGFSFPVVPKGEARIRVQLSAAHSREQVDRAIAAFTSVGKKYNILKN